MTDPRTARRSFFTQSAAVLVAGGLTPYFFSSRPSWSAELRSHNDRLHVGAIGLGGRGRSIARQASQFGAIVARCDVDALHLGNEANDKTHFSDYRKLLERHDIDVVTIGTPDHWHTKIAIEAMQAGKDVYCENPSR